MKVTQASISCKDGSLHPLINRSFTKNTAYTGLKLEDILAFLDARIEAAKIILKVNLKNIKDKKQENAYQQIMDEKCSYLDILKNQYTVHFQGKSFSGKFAALAKQPQDRDLYDASFNSIVNTTAQYFASISIIACPDRPVKEITQELNRVTAHLQSNRKRPVQQHHYTIKKHNVEDIHVPTGHFTKNQRAIMRLNGIQYYPHSLRTMSSKIRNHNQLSACNLLNTQLKINGKKIFSAYRHGSQSTLLIDDKSTRRLYSMESLKQILGAMVKDKIYADPEIAKGVIDLPITFISLLSPLGVLNAFDDTNQQRQIADLKFLIRSAHLRVFDIEVNGITYKVKPDFIYFNLGVNEARGLRDTDLEQKINYRGMTQYVIEFIKWMQKKEHPPLLKKWLYEVEHSKYYESFQAFYRHFQENTQPKLHKLYEGLEALNEELFFLKHSSILHKVYSNIDGEIRLVQNRINELKSMVKPIEAELHLRHQLFYENFKSHFRQTQSDLDDAIHAQKDNLTYRNLFNMWTLFLDSLVSYFGTPRGSHGFFSSKVSPWARKIHENSLLHLGFSEKIQENAENYEKYNYQFQMRALALSHMMGRNAEWCCKSGEDRTGLMNDFMNAMMLFIEIYRLPPRVNSPFDQRAFHEIFSWVLNCSPQKWSNAANSPGERGKKVSSVDLKFLSAKLQELVEQEKAVGKLQVTLTDLAPNVEPMPVQKIFAKKTPQRETPSTVEPDEVMSEEFIEYLSHMLACEDADPLQAFMRAEEAFYLKNHQRIFVDEYQSSPSKGNDEFKP